MIATIERGKKTNRVRRLRRTFTPRKCCGHKRGPHLPGCLGHKAGRGNGKAGWIKPDDRGLGKNAADETIVICVSMFVRELAELDALAKTLKANRSHTIRTAIRAMLDKSK